MREATTLPETDDNPEHNLLAHSFELIAAARRSISNWSLAASAFSRHYVWTVRQQNSPVFRPEMSMVPRVVPTHAKRIPRRRARTLRAWTRLPGNAVQTTSRRRP